jgi:hypothetical protein
MFGLIAHGLLCGAPDLRAIWKRAAALSQAQRKAIGLNVRNKGGRLVMPSYDAINNFINGVDPEALARALNQWLAAHQDKLPKSLTLAEVDADVSPFPHIAQVIKCTRIYRETKEGAEPEMSVRLFGTSHRYGSKSAAQIGKLIREHWSVENRNHRKRDATYWREHRAPKRNPRSSPSSLSASGKVSGLSGNEPH